MKTYELIQAANGAIKNTSDSHRNGRSGSSINNSKETLVAVGASNHSLKRKFVTSKEETGRKTFPMNGEEAASLYSSYLTPFEKDEIRTFEQVHFVCLNKKKLYGGSYDQTDDEG